MDDFEVSQPKRRRCLLLCGHCDSYLPKSTYYRHRDAYFNPISGQWQQGKDSDDVPSHPSSSVSSDAPPEHGEDFDGHEPDKSVSSESESDCASTGSKDLELEEIWLSSSEEEGSVTIMQGQINEQQSQPTWQLVFFLLMWQSLHHISNAAMNILLKFFALFVQLFGHAFTSDSAQAIPRDISAAHKYLWNSRKDEFISYVVCPKCESVYDYDDCFVTSGGKKESKSCRHVAYPKHPHASRRQECGAQLLKKVKSGKNYKLIPRKEFPYQPLQKSLCYLTKREGFLDACEKWRGRLSHGYLGDIYDGRVWHDFESESTGRYLQAPYCYLLTLNVDWFQPFTHTQYSVGAIYLTVLNLPRNMRYKEENVILVGLIPGPTEPSLTINTYLTPLVHDLQQAWNPGLTVTTPSNSVITVRLALSCVTCDIPASRKVCGFLGHNAMLGCNKCYKQFQSLSLGETDYSGYDRNNWTIRDCKSHRLNCREILKETTKTGLRKKESEFGVRYSVLLSLAYFDPIRYTAIDVMHNLFLGSGKHVFKTWMKLEMLNSNILEEIDRRINAFTVPNFVGRLPINIQSNYGGFKAAQWQSWITVYSPVVLKGLIPDNHLRCWLLFVRACAILSQRVLRDNDVNTADLLLLSFCKQFQELYGSENCTPNQHLHLHIKECLLDFGPSHVFWCFSFERYNGLLGSYHTNRKSIEQQIMRKFVNTQRLRNESVLANTQLLSLLPSDSFQRLPTLTTAASLEEEEILRLLTLSSTPLNLDQSHGL